MEMNTGHSDKYVKLNTKFKQIFSKLCIQFKKQDESHNTAIKKINERNRFNLYGKNIMPCLETEQKGYEKVKTVF